MQGRSTNDRLVSPKSSIDFENFGDRGITQEVVILVQNRITAASLVKPHQNQQSKARRELTNWIEVLQYRGC